MLRIPRRIILILVGVAVSLSILAVFLGFLTIFPPAATVTPAPPAESLVDVTYDYLIVGETLAALAAAADLREADPDATIAIVNTGQSATAAFPLDDPPSYDGSYGDTLHVDWGPYHEVNLLTMTESRRWLASLNLTVYASPYWHIAVGRGRRVVCDLLTNLTGADVYSFSDFCHDDDVFIDETTGAYGDSLFDSYSGNPRLDSWNYLLQGFAAPEFDTLLQLANNYSEWGTGDNERPVNSSQCDFGLDCPIDVCSLAPDWRTLVAEQMASTFAKPLAYDWAEWLAANHLGETAPNHVGAGACNYAATLSHELLRSVVYLHPKGDFAAVRAALKGRAAAHHITMLPADSSLVLVDDTKVGWTNATHRVIGRFLTMLTDPTTAMATWEGDAAEILQARRELARAQGEPLTTVLVRWPAGTPPWFHELLDEANGNYSIRVYGDFSSCLERIDIIDTPYHRCVNTIRMTSKRRDCEAFWARLATNETELTDYALKELRNAFPTANLTSPESVEILRLDEAWFTVDSRYDDISHEEAAEWAANPISNVSLCLASASVAQYTGASSEAEFRSARQCLYTHLATALPSLEEVWANRDELLIGDGLSPGFATIPAIEGVRRLANEEWWPIDFSSQEALPDEIVDYCAASLVEFTNYTTEACENSACT